MSKRARLPGQNPLCHRKFGQPNAEACGRALSLMPDDMESLLTFGFDGAVNDVKLPLTFTRRRCVSVPLASFAPADFQLCKEDCVIQVESLSLHAQADRDYNGSLKLEAIETITNCVQGPDRYGGESKTGEHLVAPPSYYHPLSDALPLGLANNLAIYVFAHDSDFAREDAIAEAAIAECFGRGLDASDTESTGSCPGRARFQDMLNSINPSWTYCASLQDCLDNCIFPPGCDCVQQKSPQAGMLFGIGAASLREGVGSCVASLAGNAGSVVTRDLNGYARALGA
ncbi:MAG: hypothetical protein M1836_005541 [Candelina mexicana]|nr:MAG: hypothetical protein M1836_005541 [Candelina mexicana]